MSAELKPCPHCAAYKEQAERCDRLQQSAHQLFVTYYKQCLAQEKGIRRLKKLIHRLRNTRAADKREPDAPPGTFLMRERRQHAAETSVISGARVFLIPGGGGRHKFDRRK